MLKLYLLFYFNARDTNLYTFIDLHCHTLFGVDDGAENFEMTKKMLNIAYNDGIKTICLTPHFKIYRYESDDEIKQHNNRVIENFELVNKYAKEAWPDMRLLLGSEIMYHNDICDSLLSGHCRFINQSSYLLIEFRPNTSKFDIQNAISKLTRRGYRPVIAHIERYSAFASDFAFLVEMKNAGAMLQVNSSSILKFKIGKTARLIKKALKLGLIDVISTDAHDNKYVTPSMSMAHKKIEKKFGEIYAKKLFHDNALSIINNDYIS